VRLSCVGNILQLHMSQICKYVPVRNFCTRLNRMSFDLILCTKVIEAANL